MSNENTWAETLLREIDDRGTGLTDYEVRAIEGFRRRLDGEVGLTDRQEELLAQIHEERVT